MAGYQAGNPALGNMPMPNNGPNGAMRMPDEHIDEANYEARLNTLIYGYLCQRGNYESARALKNSGMPFEPPLIDGDVDGMNETDSKDNIDKKNLPEDLPHVNIPDDGQGGPFLLSWFALFWDFFLVQRKDPRGSKNAMNFVNHSQNQARLRQDQQQRIFQGAPVMNNRMAEYQLLQMQGNLQNENLRQRALQNNRMQPTPQQLQQLRAAQMGNLPNRRDPAMDMNGQRPRTPSGGDHAPSPSKRPRMEGVPFDGPQMMPNGRGPQGMPPSMMGGDVAAINANHLLMNNGINPGNLSDSQFASFQQQNPAVQQKSIQVYAQNLARNQRQQSMSNAGGVSDQGSPIMDSGMGDLGGPDFYGAGGPTAMQMRGAPPNGPNGGAGGNHALQDYQMQLMLLEQQNKKRLLMARQEQDTIGGRPDGQPGMPGAPGFIPGMSPGSRGGPSPGPSDTKRGTPKMNQVGLPGGGSPMPDGSMRGSPAAMNFNMNPDMYAQINGNGMRPPPSSNPGFGGQQFSQQQMEAMTRQAAGRGMANGWQHPQGQPQMMGQPQPQQPAPMGTPQTRNTDMPPPQGVPNTATNGRPASPAAPPTPQTASKAAPKGKKEPRDRKKPTKKNSMASVTATPASEAETQPPGTPTPATPSTPRHADSLLGPKTEGQGPGQPNMMPGMANGGVEQIPPPQPDPNAMQFGMEATDESYSITFNNDLSHPDLLENFDFEQFLQNTEEGFSFDPSAFEGPDGMEAGMTGT